MARESLAGVKAAAAETEKRLSDEIASLQTRFAAARAERDSANASNAELLRDNNGLRDALFDAQQELARRAGYMQAIEDSMTGPMSSRTKSRMKSALQGLPSSAQLGGGPKRRVWPSMRAGIIRRRATLPGSADQQIRKRH